MVHLIVHSPEQSLKTRDNDWRPRFTVPVIAMSFLLGIPAAETAAQRATPCYDDLPMELPSLVFTGRATPAMLEAPVRGAGRRLEARFSGSVRAQLFEVDQLAGRDGAQVPPGTREVLVVPWDYAADCRPERWTSERWVEAGTSGLIYGRLRAPSDWVDGVPTIDVREPYQLPYPRSADRFLTIDDAFTLLSLLPSPRDLDGDVTESLRPLFVWIRDRPELRSGEPGYVLRALLTHLTFRRVREVEPPIAGTYRFTVDLGDGRPRTFYGRTEAHPDGPDRVEDGTAYMNELRPPRAAGYRLIVGLSEDEDALPAHRDAGEYSVIRVDLDPVVQAGGARVWRARGEVALKSFAYTPDEMREMVLFVRRAQLQSPEYNLPPTDPHAAFRMLPDGRVTFQERYEMAGRGIVVLRGERTSRVVMQLPP